MSIGLRKPATSEIRKTITMAEQGDADAQCKLGYFYGNRYYRWCEDDIISNDDVKAAKWYLKAAEQGHARAQSILGDRYRDGKGVPQNDAEAIKWYCKAAEQGDADAQTDLGSMYRNGKGVPRNNAEALKWYRKAAEQRSSEAQNALGLMYDCGEGVSQDHVEAAKWFHKAAEQGHKIAQYNLAMMYKNGEGVPQNDREAAKWCYKATEGYGNANAVKWLHKEAEQGNAEAQYWLGDYYYGHGPIDNRRIDYTTALEWYQKAADQGNAEAQCQIGEMYYLGLGVDEDNETALEWYHKAAEQGNAKAQYKIGNVYYLGLGVDEDNETALEWFHKAAEQGYQEAQYNIGDIYYYGYGVDVDNETALEWYQKAAEQGNAEAQYKIGNIYYNGKGVDVDYETALEWFHKAAEQGYAEAQYQIGDMYYNGEGVDKDYEMALEWYHKAAEQGYAKAQCKIGDMYFNGEGVDADHETALGWYCKAAEQRNTAALKNLTAMCDKGNSAAQFHLGWMYSNGKGVPQSDVEAAQWYNKAAEQGNATALSNLTELCTKGNDVAQFYLGWMYSKGKGVPQDYTESMKWYCRAAEQRNLPAQNNIGVLYENGQGVPRDNTEALKWYRRAAEQRAPYAQRNIGRMYQFGKGVQQDDNEAAQWYNKAAEQGNATALSNLTELCTKGNDVAQFYLGRIHQNGKGVPQDDVEAVKWYRKSAEQDHATAQFWLGWMYQNGKGIPQDDAEAAKWFHKAAEQGNADGQNWLGWMYRNGKGVPQDNAEAVKWFRKAAKQGHADAQKNLDEMKAEGNKIDKAVTTSGAKNKKSSTEDLRLREVEECNALLEACTPHLYIHNAFRISGITVDASPLDIKRRFDDLKSAAEMGDLEGELSHAFALDPVPSLDQIREAAQKFQDPEKRIIDEFFWFWPLESGKSGNDSALKALKKCDSDKALQIWLDALSGNHSPRCTIAKHNLAVMYHLKALDSEQKALVGDLLSEQLIAISKDWSTCFEWWEALVDDDELWSLVADRIRTIDDSRLTTGFVRRLCATLPEAMDKINAMLARDFAERGKLSHATNHINYMKQTHQGKDNIPKTLSIVTKPLKARVDTAVDTATHIAKNQPSQAAKAAFELLQAISEPMKVIQTILPSEDHKRIDLCDQVAEVCLTCQIAYARETDDWKTCLEILDAASKYAVSKDTKKHLADERFEVVANKHLDSLRKKIEEIEKSKVSISNKINNINDYLLQELSKIKNSSGMSDDVYEKCANYVARYLRDLSVSEYNEHDNLQSALRIIEISLSVARGRETQEKLQEDKAKLINIQKEATKHNLQMQIRSDEIEVTREFVRYNSQKIAVPMIQGIKYGIYIVRNQYGTQTTTSYLIEIADDLLSIPVPANALLQQCMGGIIGSHRIKIECNRFLRNEAQISEDFNRILDALFHQVFPSLIQRFAEDIVSGTPLQVGYCRLANEGIYITTGALLWKKETLVNFSDLNFSKYSGQITVSSVKDKELHASMAIRDTWNAALLEYITKAVVEMKNKS